MNYNFFRPKLMLFYTDIVVLLTSSILSLKIILYSRHRVKHWLPPVADNEHLLKNRSERGMARRSTQEALRLAAEDCAAQRVRQAQEVRSRRLAAELEAEVEAEALREAEDAQLAARMQRCELQKAQLRQDQHLAQRLQQREVQKAREGQLAGQRVRMEQQRQDAELAHRLQQRELHQNAHERQDAELAHRLQQREVQRFREVQQHARQPLSPRDAKSATLPAKMKPGKEAKAEAKRPVTKSATMKARKVTPR